MMAKEPELSFANFSENLTNSIQELTSSVFQPLFMFLNDWASNLSRDLIDKNIDILTYLTDIKEKLSKKLGDLQGWFKYQINDRLRTIDILIDDQLETQLKQQEGLMEKIEAMESQLKNQIGSAFSSALEKTLQKYTVQLDDIIESLEVAGEGSAAVLTKIEAQKQQIDQGVSTFNETASALKKTADGLMSQIEINLNTSLGSAGSDIDKIVETQRDFVDSIRALKNIVDQL